MAENLTLPIEIDENITKEHINAIVGCQKNLVETLL